MKKPNLFILGAPKCGTTSLMSWFTQHPEVYTSPVKEPNHFYSPYGPPLDRGVYEALFANAEHHHRIIVEASVWYLFAGNAVDKILEYNRDATFIVCLRSPVEMLPSLHAQKIYTGHEAIFDIEKAWGASAQRRAGERLGIIGLENGDPAHMAYKDICALGAQVSVLLSKVERDRVQFVFLDDLSSEPERAFGAVCEALRIRGDFPVQFRRENQAKKVRSRQLRALLDKAGSLKKALGIRRKSGLFAPVHALNISHERYDSMRPEFAAEVKRFFAADIAVLEELTGRMLSAWLE